jgi:hypothetical protein
MKSQRRGNISIIEPAARKDFWEFLISRHPIEEDYESSTKQAYRWRRIPKLRLVVVQFVSEHGVGVFVRCEKGANPDEVEHRLRPYAAELKKALGVDEFFFARSGTPPAKFFFQKFNRLNSSRPNNWGKMADWLHKEADAYQNALENFISANEGGEEQ